MQSNYDADITGGSLTKLSITVNDLKGVLSFSLYTYCLGGSLKKS